MQNAVSPAWKGGSPGTLRAIKEMEAYLRVTARLPALVSEWIFMFGS